jgi:hypothetical protein
LVVQNLDQTLETKSYVETETIKKEKNLNLFIIPMVNYIVQTPFKNILN